MTLRGQRTLQALVLAAIGFYLLNLVWSGRLGWYIHSRFLPLTLVGAVGLLFLAQAQMTARPPFEAGGIEAEVGGGGHQPVRAAPGSRRRLLLLLLPVLLGMVIPAAPLSASAVEQRGVVTNAPVRSSSNPQPVRFTLAPEERTILDWLLLFQEDPGSATFAGQPADVTGFVYRDPRVGEGEFLLSRFAVTCCVADATALGLLIQWPGAADLTPERWVRVRGTTAVGELTGRPSALVQAASVEPIDPPDQPYLFP